MFRNREDAARKLVERMRDRPFKDPLVLAIPRGGVVLGAVLARALHADLDVVLSRKLRAPEQPELALGAISENGEVHLNSQAGRLIKHLKEYLAEERRHQLAEIARRKKLIRSVLPEAPVAGRSVIVTDDGIATGSTMIAALTVLRRQHPAELIVAVPVASPDRLAEVRRLCDEAICLIVSEDFSAIGQFYEDFDAVGDDQVLECLRAFAPEQALNNPAQPAGQQLENSRLHYS